MEEGEEEQRRCELCKREFTSNSASVSARVK